MLEWMNEKNEERKQNATLSPEIRFAVDRFFFNHYCKWFRTGKAIACTTNCPYQSWLTHDGPIRRFRPRHQLYSHGKHA